MSEIDSERYKVPEGVETSYSAMKERLTALQPSLRALMGQAVELFDGVYPQAPHPSEDATVAYAVATMDICPIEEIPMGRELTVVLGGGKWVRVFRNTDSSPDNYPRKRLWFCRPEGEASFKVNVLRTHDPARAEYPYDIETADYTEEGMIIGFVGGADYYGKEPYITEARKALAAAKQITKKHGLFIA